VGFGTYRGLSGQSTLFGSASYAWGHDEVHMAMVGQRTTARMPEKFHPASMTVKAGSTVKFIDDDEHDHTVTSGTRESPDGLFDSGVLHPGSRIEFHFDTPGVYHYFCSLHPGMAGTITVVGRGGAGGPASGGR